MIAVIAAVLALAGALAIALLLAVGQKVTVCAGLTRFLQPRDYSPRVPHLDVSRERLATRGR